MKKYIRDLLDDLNGKTAQAPLPEDLDNQELSKDPAERVRQLDYQAQKSEEEQTLG